MLKTLYNTYLDLRQELRLKGISMYQLEAKEIIAFALDIPRDKFNERDERIVFLKEQEKIDSLVRLRLAGTPLPHIIGEWDFYGLTFEVTTNTLIPRSDTECIAEEGINFLNQFEKGRILDLCCGTGCIGITLLKNAPDHFNCVFGDISDYAIRVTKNNIMKHNVTGRALTMKLNALEPYSPVIGKFQLIVSNPPYIPTADIETLDSSVKDHEPILALDGGEDGLMFYRSIAESYIDALAKNGALLFECGIGQAEDIISIMENCGYERIKVIKDLSGIDRGVMGFAPSK